MDYFYWKENLRNISTIACRDCIDLHLFYANASNSSTMHLQILTCCSTIFIYSNYLTKLASPESAEPKMLAVH